jgi:hypothetical protein
MHTTKTAALNEAIPTTAAIYGAVNAGDEVAVRSGKELETLVLAVTRHSFESGWH